MAFNYDKTKQAHGNDSFWTSYSDLFLGLSTIFLLLYVVASLRTSTDAIKNQSDNQKLSMQVQELQNQLKMYESVKTNYMESAAKDEQQEYQELMDKLTLLQEESKSEKDRLNQEAAENGKKAQALNKYQQMIRNVLNANKVAKSRIITRNDVIGEQDVQIDDQKKNITELQTDVAKKSQLIQDGNRKIAESESQLKQRMQDLKKAYQHNKMTKKAYEKQAQSIKDQAQKHVAQLKNQNQQYSQQLNQTNQKLNQLNSELQNTQTTLAQTAGQLQNTTGQLQNTKSALAQTAGQLENTKSALSQKEGEVQGLQGTVQGLQGKLQQASGEAAGLKEQMGNLQKGYAAKAAADKAAFEGEMGRLKLGAAERAAREGQFRAQAEGRAKELQGQLQGLAGKLKDTEGALAKAKEEMDTRKNVAAEISKSFQKAGVKADIDGGTGEVVLDFGNAYFDNDSSNLKQEMRKVLEKAMPAYSSSLFGNPKIANKISTVEIIGFASPTYKGKFVDPHSSKPEDRAALKYNMDLSYRRANAIFQYLLDGKNPQFANQQDLIAMTKVSGRSFLEVMKVQGRNLSTDAEFCRVNDCRKAQRVIIRFSMDGKK